MDISNQLLGCLKELKKNRSAKTLKEGWGELSNHWLFGSRANRLKPLNYQTWRRDIFNSVLSVAGLRKIRVHDLRHTYASLLIYKDCSLIYIRDQLGHSSIKVTADVYGQLVRGNKEKPVDVLDNLLHPVAP